MFVIGRGQLLVVANGEGLARAARDILGLPESQIIAPVHPAVDWVRPFLRELQKEDVLVTSVLIGHPWIIQPTALVRTDGGSFEAEWLGAGIDATGTQIEDRGNGDHHRSGFRPGGYFRSGSARRENQQGD